MPLTTTECKLAAPKVKDYKPADGEGLFVLVKTNGYNRTYALTKL